MITFQFDTFTENDEPVTVDIRCDVSKCTRAYGVAGSPDLYEVDIYEVTLDGKPFNLIEVDRAEEQAIKEWRE